MSSSSIKVTPAQHAEVLRKAFALVHPPEDWKGEIDALIPSCSVKLYADAVEFMTGTNCWFTHEGDYSRIRSIGYRKGPAGP